MSSSSLSVTLRLFAGLMVALGTAGVASGQELKSDDSFTPSNESIDSDLDRTLESEYTDERGEPVPDYAADSDGGQGAPAARNPRDRVRLRIMGAYWRANLSGAEIEYGVGGFGGETIKLNDPDNDQYDEQQFDDVGAGTYRMTLDLGRFVSLTGSFRHARFTASGFVTPGEGFEQGFDYGSTTWNLGDPYEAEIEVWTGDLDVLIRPVNRDCLTVDLSVGARYSRWETTLGDDVTPGLENTVLESVIPMLGLGVALRPLQELEFFGKVRVGYLGYEIEDEDDPTEDLERESTSLEVDLGISVTIADTIGFVVGYRLDYIEIERTTVDRDQRVGGTVHGPYAGLILNF